MSDRKRPATAMRSLGQVRGPTDGHGRNEGGGDTAASAQKTPKATASLLGRRSSRRQARRRHCRDSATPEKSSNTPWSGILKIETGAEIMGFNVLTLCSDPDSRLSALESLHFSTGLLASSVAEMLEAFILRFSLTVEHHASDH
ncbi:hypothetical protein OH76DRAFT_1483839 [Lentinus brumalis]|uniref:Uncharacterized protein n=1 Tax=Lentinus brumalis TaxID=2498619 RepID=A0A371D7D8_9APHY|nr:hypothetical protein OH76DRAFT_1483839 [Polyporus brumalis]